MENRSPKTGVQPAKFAIRLTIGAKLVSLMAIVLLGAVTSLAWFSTRLFVEDTTALIQQMNADAAASYAAQVRGLLKATSEKIRSLGRVLLKQPRVTQNAIFEEDPSFLAVFLRVADTDKGQRTAGIALSPQVSAIEQVRWEEAIAQLALKPDFQLSTTEQGEPQMARVTLPDGTPAIAIAIPFVKSGERFSHILVGILRQGELADIFSEADAVTGFLVNRLGKLLAHQDPARALLEDSVVSGRIVRLLLEGKSSNGQTTYTDPQSGEKKLGAFHSVGFAGAGVVAEVPEDRAYAAARHVQYRGALVALIVLCISFLLGYLFSGSITWPIEQLARAAARISEGDFKVRIQPKGSDEIAYLSRAFNAMVVGLEERDRVKAVFNKFHSKEIAEKILSGDLKLGGERKQALIFFSDVRGFTAMSETMPPEAVVEMLNEYISRMVAIIRKHGGVVDKYVGDAIMALWGVPLAHADDIGRALRACLEMREELEHLNAQRLRRAEVPLRMGMGLNYGHVIAGNIGSEERMEYTVIGDAVNLASRLESATKEYGTDFLVPSVIHEAASGAFVFEKCGDARVKGKSEAIEVYRVLGYVDDQGNRRLVSTPYSSFEPEKKGDQRKSA